MKKSLSDQPQEVLLALLQEQQSTIKVLTTQIEEMQQRMDKLLHMLFGTKSEKSSHKNKSKDKDDEALLVAPKKSGKRDEKCPPQKNGRGTLPEDLPRIKVKHELPSEQKYCKCCETSLHCIGKIVTEQLGFKPAKFFVKEHTRYKYACRSCEKILTTDLPPQPIDKGLADAGVLTEVLLNKYQDALPLYRQQQRFMRHGINLSRSTLCDWVTQSAHLLEPIVNGMKNDTLIPGKRIFTDDTTVPVMDKKKPGKTHTGRLWTYVGGGTIKPLCAIYEYTPTRQKSAPKKFLTNFSGFLQADAYPGYDELYQSGSVIEIACWAHARRKFTDIIKASKLPGNADIAVDYIGQLYKVERIIKNFPAPERKHYRRHYSRPILKRFKRWLKRRQRKVLPKSPIGKAINYVLNHWRALNNYICDGILEIDNNTAERAIKPLVLGRKNYLFAGSHEGAKRAAIIYSIIETCKLNSINPWNYLNDILTRLPTTLMKDIKQLYPYNWVTQKDPSTV